MVIEMRYMKHTNFVIKCDAICNKRNVLLDMKVCMNMCFVNKNVFVLKCVFVVLKI